ncbi:probable calcium-binding protein CML16 [Brachypodium distachyon]|uniref:EF-hand domain-containing protein n=1 Tax=Brachypodium distachyon TaxID=15368 RepID=I1HBR4_BRADI|nr:probable calcium-binding protein CML16 [Brachypodium distachyon]KQK02566.1 hypothetical protein BRADI_2g02340v3 [Brachypodium distachyon]|eukprot:XP_003568182.1 probable calcium-binding protein CML16 [Brachypodium distachyon]
MSSGKQKMRKGQVPASLAAGAGAGEDAEMKKLFSRFDADGDGRISPSELAAVSRAIAPPPSESAGGREVASMMDQLDADRDGFVDLGEFAAFHSHTDGREEEEERELRDAFAVYDIDGDGRISVAELAKVLARIGEGCSTEECQRMIASVDVDGDGCVGFEEFKKMMSRDAGAAHADADAGVPDKPKKE